jgi:hypothetical protein
MREKDLKALVHGFLAILGAIELANAETKSRQFLLGCATGWHANCTFYHLFLEKEDSVRPVEKA